MTTWTDLFAGAGGSSTGIVAHGADVRYAANHWDLAVEVHNANHPTTDHLCADISQFDPRRIARTDCLWASPECTTHSRARGRRQPQQPDLFGDVLPDAAVERSRTTMWDVVRFTEHHQYQAVIVENVVEILDWLPYQAWLAAMGSLGYLHREVFLNSMHAQAGGLPAPQSRDRIYVVFWRRGNPAPDIDSAMRPQAWCGRCETVVESGQAWKPGRTAGRYRAQYVYTCSTCGTVVEPGWLPAAAAIDWDLPGHRIGDRAKPLADKTRARIAAGIARYWGPFHMEKGGNQYDAADPKHPQHGQPGAYYRVWPVSDPLRTLHTIESKALLVPSGGTWSEDARPADEPHRTITTREHMALAFIAELRGGGSTARTVTEPLATVTASGNHHGLVMPYYGASAGARTTEDPIGTLTTRDRYALIMRNNTARGDQGQMSTPATEPLRTLTTTGHQSLITAGEAAEMVDDCLFRMLEPTEVARGMAFPADYLWSGTRRERVQMAGNAVTPPAARDLVGAVVASLGGAA